jgi:hypothetical protein
VTSVAARVEGPDARVERLEDILLLAPQPVGADRRNPEHRCESFEAE